MFGKKKNEKIDKEINFDSDLDLGGFDFDMPEAKDDRKPATKLADGFLSGAKDGVRDTSFLKKTMKDILPEGYGQTMDLSDKVASHARNIYDDAAKEIKPAIKDFKRVAAKLVPKDSALVPKSISSMMSRWEEEGKDNAGDISKNSQREDFLNIQLTEAFKEQFIQGAKERSEDIATDRMQQGLEMSRHKDMFGGINQANQHLSSIDHYNTKVTLQYQKKSLEVNYRQLFALQDILEETQKSFALQTTSFKDIVKNTALPDFVKIKNAEFRAQVFKNKFYESMQRGLFGGRDDYIEKIATNLKTMITDKVTNAASDFRSGLANVEMGADTLKGMEGPGVPGGLEMTGQVGGGMAAQWGFARHGQWIKKNVIDKNETVKKYGTKLSNRIDNLPNEINDWRNSDQHEETYDDSQSVLTKTFNLLARTVQSLLPGTSNDNTFEKTSSMDMDEPYVITRRTDKSLNEVIPGYLSRILREVQILRTKNEGIELTSYDYNSNKFVDRSTAKSIAKNLILPETSAKLSDWEIDDILRQLDPSGKSITSELRKQIKTTLKDPSATDGDVSFDKLMDKMDPKNRIKGDVRKNLKKILEVKNANTSATAKSIDELMEQLGAETLAPEAKVELRRKLLRNSANQRGATEVNLGNKNSYSDEHGESISALMTSFLASGDEEKIDKFKRKHNRLKDGIRDPRAIMQQMINHGDVELLQELGLVKEDGVTFDEDAYLEQFTGNIKTSDVHAKQDFKPVHSKFALNAVRNTPVTSWNYKKGKGDGGQHVGPMAQDVNKNMGNEAGPDGTKIDLTTMNGMTMSAIQELDKQINPTGEKPKDKQLSTRDFLDNHLQSIRCLLGEIKEVSKAGINIGLGNIPNFTTDIDFSKFNLDGFDSEKFKAWFAKNRDKAMAEGEKAKQVFDDTVPGMLSSMMYQGAGGVGSAYKSTASFLGKAKDYVKEKTGLGIKKSKDWYDNDVYDVYFEGETIPRLFAAQISAGNYLDVNSSEIIDHANKITGEVRNIKLDTIVIKAEEVPFLYSVNPKTRTKRFFSSTKEKISGYLRETKNWILKQYPGALKTAKDKLKDAWEGTKSLANQAYALIDNPIDIYVKGDSLPTLLAMTMEGGGYYSCLTKKVVIRPGEIDGPVMDSNGKTILSLDQIKLGLVDFKGDPIKTPLDKLKNGLESISKLGMRAGNWVMTNLKAAGNAVARGINGLFSDFSIEINSKRSLTVLEQIRDLLYSKYNTEAKPRQKQKRGKNKVTDNTAPAAPDTVVTPEVVTPAPITETLAEKLNTAYDSAVAKLKDIYVQGESSPRIIEAKLVLGHYRDKLTNKVITNVSEITGEVVDENNKVVITNAEVLKLAFFDAKDEMFKKLELLKSNEQILKMQTAVINALPAGTMAKMEETKDKIKNAIGITKDTILDVYIEGSKDPVMYATKIVQGLYKDKETQKPILHQSEIEGEVIDENNNTIINRDQIVLLRTFNIVTKRFSALKLVGRGLLSLARGLWHYQTQIAPKMVAFNFKVIGKTLKFAGTMAARMLGISKGPSRDVFVGDEKEPRLYGKKIDLGHYSMHSTGIVVKHHTDITGEVQDENGTIVLFDADLDYLRVYNSILRVFNPLKLVGYVFKKVSQGASWLVKKTIGAGAAASKWALGKLGKGMIKLVGSSVGWMMKPGTVHVVGRPLAVLAKSTMEAGGYSSEKTKKIITCLNDIDGPVKDEATGEIILSEEDIKAGLTNAKGEPLKSTLLGSIGKGLGKLNRMFSMRVALKGERKTLTFGPTVAERTEETLKELLAITKAKFSPKKIMGDKDGDGIREGSYEDLARKKGFLFGSKKTDETTPKGAVAKPKEPPTLLSKLFTFFGKGEKIAEDSNDKLETIRDVLVAQAAKDGIGGLSGGDGPDKGKGKGKVGKVGKLAKFGGNALKYGGGALAGAGIAYGGYNAYKSIQAGDYTGAATDAGIAVASGVAGTAVLGGASSMLAGGTFAAGAGASLAASGTLAAAIAAGTVAAAPFILAGALIGGLGYLGYKHVTRNDLTPLQKIRYVQYGFNKSDTQYVSKVLQLEEYLSDKTDFPVNVASINEDKVVTKEIMAIFGLDSKEPKDLNLFFGWYQKRFKPVYLTHLTCIKQMVPGGITKLSDAEKFKNPDKKAYIESTSFPDGPYSFTALPIDNPGYVVALAQDVKDVIAEVIKELGLDKVTATAQNAVSVYGSNNAGEPDPAIESKTLPGKMLNEIEGTTKTPGSDINASSPITKAMLSGNDMAYALDAVRYRSYGLVDLEPSKIRSLKMLEEAVLRNTTFVDKSNATWEGNPLTILEELKGSFGLSTIYGDEAHTWCKWFKNRFLPIYMGYLSGYAMYTGKQDTSAGVSLLKPVQQVDLAKAIVGISGIWSVNDSPWSNYLINVDPDTTKENIAFLESVAKENKATEEKKSVSNSNEKSAVTKPTDESALAGKTNQEIGTTAPAGDGEAKPAAGASATPKSYSAGGALPMAGGALVDGANGASFVDFTKGATLENVNPALAKLFYGMVEEYNTLTGKRVSVNDGYRTYAMQAAMKQKYGAGAAAPGSSPHEFGLAIDVDSKTLDEMEKLGLMKKYGMTRPLGGEPWHLEPAGIQADIAKYKKNQDAAIEAIEFGIGKGGGGFATIAGAPKPKRNTELAISLLEQSSTPTIKDTEPQTVTASPGATPTDTTNTGAATTASAEPKKKGMFGGGLFGGKMFAADKATDAAIMAGGGKKAGDIPAGGENKPAAVASTGKSDLGSRTQTNPADPSIKVTAPTGSGYAGLKDTVVSAAKMVGCDPDLALGTCAVESDFKPGSAAGASSAKGLFQFTSGTWKETVGKYGSKYGYTEANADPLDPVTNSIMGAHFIKANVSMLKGKLGREATATDAYVTHLLGATGGMVFLNALKKTPNELAATLLPNAAASNENIFYEGSRPRTVSEVYALLDQKVREKAKYYGIDMPEAAPPAKTMIGGMFAADKATDAAIVAGTAKAPTTTPTQAPAASKQSVSSSVASIGRSPVSDSYGFTSPAKVQDNPVNQNVITGELFKTTEGLLSENLDVNKQILDVLKNIFGVVSTKTTDKPEVKSNTPPTLAPYTAPRGPVSMRKSIA